MVGNITYWLDANKRLAALDDTWTKAAIDNPALAPDALVGRPLADFIAGDAPRMHVYTILDAVRLLGQARSAIYRCDSPEARRSFEMRVSLEPSGLLRVEHHLVKFEPVADQPLFFTKPKATWLRCSWCNRLMIDNRWIEADRVPTDRIRKLAAVRYTVCGECRTDMQTAVENRGT